MVLFNVFAPIIYKKRLFSTPIVPLLVCKSGTIATQRCLFGFVIHCTLFVLTA